MSDRDTNFAPWYYNSSCGHSHPWGTSCSVAYRSAEAAQGAAPRHTCETTACCATTLVGAEPHEHEWTAGTGPSAVPGLPASSCIEAEAAQGAAPRAEGLDVIHLARAMRFVGIRDASIYADRVAAEYLRLRSPESDEAR